MKHVSISLVILSVLLIFCLLSSAYISKVVDHTSALLENAAEEAYRAQTVDLVKEASSYWEQHQHSFCMLLRHDEVDEVVCEMALLQAYAIQEDWDDFDGNCASLLARLQHIKEMEKPSLHNIF